jgi:hypothetical protein
MAPPARLAALLAAYGAGLAAAAAAGFRMAIPYHYFQLLAREPLTTRLGESLWNLHAQPPLLNLLLGLALKLERATGLPPETALLVLQIAAGAAIVLGLDLLMRRMNVSPWARRTVLALVLLDPAFYGFVLAFFHPVYELLFLTLAALLVQRFLAEGRTRDYAGAAACLLALTYTRALFHFGWTLAVLLLLALAGRDRSRRPVLATLALAALLVLAWPAKNLLRFGFFGYSSWQGYNLAQAIFRVPPPAWEAFAFGSSPGIEARRAELDRRVPDRFRGIPVLAETTKAPGIPNWNHYAILDLSERLQAQTFRRLRRHPVLLARKAAANYRMATAYAARQPISGELDWRAKTPLSQAWLWAYEGAVFQYFGDDIRHGPWTGWSLLLPLVLSGAAIQAFRRRKTEPVDAGTAAFLLAAVLWVLIMVLLVDGDEGNRMRFSTQPLLLAAAAWALPRGTGQGRAERNPASA